MSQDGKLASFYNTLYMRRAIDIHPNRFEDVFGSKANELFWRN